MARVGFGGGSSGSSFTAQNISADTTLSTFDLAFVDASGGARTISMPSSPSDGDAVQIVATDTSGGNIIFAANTGQSLSGLPNLQNAGEGAVFRYRASDSTWYGTTADVLDRLYDTANDAVTSQVGTSSNRQDVYAGAIDAQSATINPTNDPSVSYPYGIQRLLADGYLVSVYDGGISTHDPSSSSAPVQDAIDQAASNGGGWVYFPPTDTKSNSEVIQETGPIVPEDEVDFIVPGECIVEITGDGNDGLRVDNSQASNTGGSLISFDIHGGRLRIEHANGPTGNTGRGCVLESNLQNSHWMGTLELSGWNGHGFYDNSATYQSVINHIHLSNINPRNETFTNIAYFTSGGAPYVINCISGGPYDDGSTGVRVCRIDGGANPQIRLINVGGAITRVIEPAFVGFHGVHVGHINWEPTVTYGTVSNIVDHRNDRPFKLDSITLRPQVAFDIDNIYNLGNGVGHGYYPLAIQNSNANVTDRLRVAQDTVTSTNNPHASLIYEGPSDAVDNNTSGTLTEPIACLADLTTVT